jgi:hypothetical protein
MKRLSNSFTREEVEIFHQMTQKLLVGSDVRGLIRSPHFAGLVRKFNSMMSRKNIPDKAKENGSAKSLPEHTGLQISTLMDTPP